MKHKFLIFCAVAITFFGSGITFGQEAEENSEKVSLSVDVANSFIWRGLANNTLPVVQPSITFSPDSRVSFGLWASTPLVIDWEQPRELDIFIDFQIAPFLTLNITDYYVYCETADLDWPSPDYSNSYFNLKKGKTRHAFDVQLIFASDNTPFKALVSTIFAGDDLNDKGKNNFSTYFEVGYGKTSKYVDWELFAGMVPMSSGFYGIDNANVVNLGFAVSKSFQITPTYSLPLALKFTVNPAIEAAYFSAVFSLF